MRCCPSSFRCLAETLRLVPKYRGLHPTKGNGSLRAVAHHLRSSRFAAEAAKALLDEPPLSEPPLPRARYKIHLAGCADGVNAACGLHGIRRLQLVQSDGLRRFGFAAGGGGAVTERREAKVCI